MPYIKQEDRYGLNAATASPKNAGELNYFIHTVFSHYVADCGESYQTYNDIIGALECAKLELYRRRISKYEEDKAKINGDIDFYKDS